MEQIEKIRNGVKSYFRDNGPRYITGFVNLSEEDKKHIINIGTSIICTRYEIGFPGGSFVQAIVNNELTETFARADDVNLKAIRFYVMLKHNFSLNKI
jgi:hypothetical protein